MPTRVTLLTFAVKPAFTDAVWPGSKSTGAKPQTDVPFTTACTETVVACVKVELFLTVTFTTLPLTLVETTATGEMTAKAGAPSVIPRIPNVAAIAIENLERFVWLRICVAPEPPSLRRPNPLWLDALRWESQKETQCS